VAIPFMIAANHNTKGTPPVAAIIVVGVIAVATLISAFGVARGLRWAFSVAIACRVIDGVSNFLGLSNHPSAATAVGGWVGFLLSIVAIVLLVRLRAGWRGARPRRRQTAGSQSPQAHPCSDRSPGPRRRDAIGACLVRGPGSAVPGGEATVRSKY
jgi:hypothetical protein